MNTSIAAICVAVLLCACCLCCGCMDAEEGTEISLVVVTPEPAHVPEITYLNEGWTIWREGSVAIGRLGGVQSFVPNKNGEYFRNIRVEVKSDGPLTLFFLTPGELVNFKNNLMTDTGNYYPVSRYDDVTAGTYTQIGDDDLTIALVNEENRPVTATVNIWYHI